MTTDITNKEFLKLLHVSFENIANAIAKNNYKCEFDFSTPYDTCEFVWEKFRIFMSMELNYTVHKRAINNLENLHINITWKEKVIV